jgi:hypothetical protein
LPKYKIVCTHNPQEFFNGAEPVELAKTVLTDDLNADVPKVLDGGYKAIVTYAGDGEDG